MKEGECCAHRSLGSTPWRLSVRRLELGLGHSHSNWFKHWRFTQACHVSQTGPHFLAGWHMVRHYGGSSVSRLGYSLGKKAPTATLSWTPSRFLLEALSMGLGAQSGLLLEARWPWPRKPCLIRMAALPKTLLGLLSSCPRSSF